MSFADRVYEVTKRIPKGKVSTYKDIAFALNCKAYRAVDSALNKNPFAPQVPCHRVINASGKLGGFASGLKKKVVLLKKEGILITKKKIDLNKFGYKF
jgi:methylated-DNA-[protein]-cysteine S-methyltransferase